MLIDFVQQVFVLAKSLQGFGLARFKPHFSAARRQVEGSIHDKGRVLCALRMHAAVDTYLRVCSAERL